MSYYRHSRRPKPVTVATQAAQDMIKFLTEVDGMSDWESNFVQSVKDGWGKYGSVTEKQYSQIQKLADRYNPENIKARVSWTESYNEGKRRRAVIAASYYKANPPYFGDLATRVLEDPDYIPTERAYNAMCENKYALKAVEIHDSEPQFPDGSMAVARTSNQTPRGIRGKTVLIIQHPVGVHSAANGAKRVVVLPVGESAPVETEERWLKKLPKKLR
jgi:hypothetical protein